MTVSRLCKILKALEADGEISARDRTAGSIAGATTISKSTRPLSSITVSLMTVLRVTVFSVTQ